MEATRFASLVGDFEAGIPNSRREHSTAQLYLLKVFSGGDHVLSFRFGGISSVFGRGHSRLTTMKQRRSFEGITMVTFLLPVIDI